MKSNSEAASADVYPATATIGIAFETSKLARIIASALRPELADPPSDRTRVDLAFKGEDTIVLTIAAKDTSALRAALNSYLRWISAVIRTVSTVEASRDIDVTF